VTLLPAQRWPRRVDNEPQHLPPDRSANSKRRQQRHSRKKDVVSDGSRAAEAPKTGEGWREVGSRRTILAPAGREKKYKNEMPRRERVRKE